MVIVDLLLCIAEAWILICGHYLRSAMVKNTQNCRLFSIQIFCYKDENQQLFVHKLHMTTDL